MTLANATRDQWRNWHRELKSARNGMGGLILLILIAVAITVGVYLNGPPENRWLGYVVAAVGVVLVGGLTYSVRSQGRGEVLLASVTDRQNGRLTLRVREGWEVGTRGPRQGVRAGDLSLACTPEVFEKAPKDQELLILAYNGSVLRYAAPDSELG